MCSTAMYIIVFNSRIIGIYSIYTFIYIYSQLPIRRTRKGPGKVSDLSEIQNIMQIRHDMRVKGFPKCGIIQQSTT